MDDGEWRALRELITKEKGPDKLLALVDELAKTLEEERTTCVEVLGRVGRNRPVSTDTVAQDST